MRRIIPLLITIITVLLLDSCCNKHQPATEYYAFLSSKNGRWGLIGNNGDVLYDTMFTLMPTSVHEERFFLRDDDGHATLYAATPSHPTKLAGGFMEVYPSTRFTDGLCNVSMPGHKNVYINRDGKVVLILDSLQGIPVLRSSDFRDGIAIVTLDKQDEYPECAINKQGKIVIPPIYSALDFVGEGKLRGQTLSQAKLGKDSVLNDSPCNIMTYKGRVLFTTFWDYISSDEFSKGAIITTSPIRTNGVLSEKGRWLYKDQNKELIENYDGLLIWSSGDNSVSGLMDYHGREWIRATKRLFEFARTPGRLFVYDDNCKTVHLANYQGHRIGMGNFSEHFPFSGGYAVVKVHARGRKDRWAFLDHNGNIHYPKVNIYDIWPNGNATEMHIVRPEIIFEK